MGKTYKRANKWDRTEARARKKLRVKARKKNKPRVDLEELGHKNGGK